MIRSNFDVLRAKKSAAENRKITLQVVVDETGVSMNAVHRISTGKGQSIHFSTVEALCKYFKLDSLCELIEYVPEAGVTEGK